MIKFPLLTVAAALILSLVTTPLYGLILSEERYIEGFGDVPLLAGYSQIADQSVIFDTPAGTIAEAVLMPEIGKKADVAAYQRSLGALGWVCKKISGSTKTSHSGAIEGLVCAKDNSLLRLMLLKETPFSGGLRFKIQPQKNP